MAIHGEHYKIKKIKENKTRMANYVLQLNKTKNHHNHQNSIFVIYEKFKCFRTHVHIRLVCILRVCSHLIGPELI